MDAIDPTRFAPDHLLTAEQIGRWLDCSVKSARNWLNRSKIRHVNAPGRTHLFRAGDVQQTLDTRKGD